MAWLFPCNTDVEKHISLSDMPQPTSPHYRLFESIITKAGLKKCRSPLRKVAVLNGGGLISVYARSLGTADFISM